VLAFLYLAFSDNAASEPAQGKVQLDFTNRQG
jgi:hypothetical protein